jgi:hypothetical protein
MIWLVIAAALTAQEDCSRKTCTITVNYPYDAIGTQDSRPSTWGTAAYDDGRIEFVVPASYRVRITRVYGNFTARMHPPPGTVLPPSTYAGALFGLLKTSNAGSPLATLSASGCLLYLQLDVGETPQHVEFDARVADGALADGVLLVRRAVYLSEFSGIPIHEEPSFIAEFRW